MNFNSKIIEMKTETKIFVILCIILTLIITTTICFSLYFYQRTFDIFPSELNNDWGAFGDFIGGLWNPIFSLCGIILVVFTLKLQMKEFQNTQEIFKSQTTYDVFFNMLKMYERISEKEEKTTMSTSIKYSVESNIKFCIKRNPIVNTFEDIVWHDLKENITLSTLIKSMLAWNLQYKKKYIKRIKNIETIFQFINNLKDKNVKNYFYMLLDVSLDDHIKQIYLYSVLFISSDVIDTELIEIVKSGFIDQNHKEFLLINRQKHIDNANMALWDKR